MSRLRKKTVYISDRGQAFYVEDMTPSHIINALTHHRQQIATLEWVLESFEVAPGNINSRIELLTDTVATLVTELANRDPADDPDDGDDE